MKIEWVQVSTDGGRTRQLTRATVEEGERGVVCRIDSSDVQQFKPAAQSFRPDWFEVPDAQTAKSPG